MGHLIYGVAPAVYINDWGLRHLQAVIVRKLRRDESFIFNWDDEPDVGGDESRPGRGRHGSVWVSKGSSLYFSYDAPREGPLNVRWLEILSVAANSPQGLRLLPEPLRE